MNKYCFILGTNPILSLAEFFSYETTQKKDSTILDITKQALIIQSPEEIPIAQWHQQLGGTIKTVRVVHESKGVESLFSYLTATNIQKLLRQTDTKAIFGFSFYGEQSRRYQRDLQKKGFTIKKQLKKNNISSRFIETDTGALTSVQVSKNNLIERGADIVLVIGINGCYVGVTESVQDFERYSARDYDRPQRDAKSGMIPPKLARMMINLALLPRNGHLVDPFCGSGTILQEALLLGVGKITGSDISEKAIADTRANIEWIKKKYPEFSAKIATHISDVSKIQEILPVASVDAIVTEPYLGPPVRQEPEVIEMLTIIQELESLYLTAFRSIAQIIKYDGRIVIVFPLFKTRHGIYSLKILETLQAMGFERINPLPSKVSLFAKIGPTARGSIVYGREGQKVEREIFIFEFKKS